MSAPPDRRAARLLAWYPRAWRDRYGEEFAELLVAEIEERPASWRRSADVAVSGLLARATFAGLRGEALGPTEQMGATLAVVGGALVAFLAFGLASWAQLTIGWRWSRPDTPATSAGMVVMSVAVAAFVVLLLLAVAPIAWSTLRQLARPGRRPLVVPTALFVGGAVLLVAGARHFENGWPGTGGHHWAHQGLVPSGPAAFLWAATLSVSSYWAHPDALRSFPVAEVVWMAFSPVAIACLAAGTVGTLRRLILSPRVLRYELRLAGAACAGMLVFFAGSCLWVVDGGSGPRNLFHTGVIDLVGLVVMIAALLIAVGAVVRARRGAVPLPARQ
jgi:hypothetical protein